MNCELCQTSFDIKDHFTLQVLCCKRLICEQCFNSKVLNPQSNSFNCPFNECQRINLENNQVTRNTETGKNLLKESNRLMCDSHQDQSADYHCVKHQTLVCEQCVKRKGASHYYCDCRKIENQSIFNYNESLFNQLKKEYEQIGRLMEQIEIYQTDKEHKLLVSQYQKIIAATKDALRPVLSSYHYEKINYFGYGKSYEDYLRFKPSYIQEKSNAVTSENNCQVTDSLLMQVEHLDFLKQAIKTEKLNLELIYRGSRDGFSSDVFHERCDNKGPTLTVIKSDLDKIFGGYASKSWEDIYTMDVLGDMCGDPIADEAAFIFSLTHLTKFEQYRNQNHALFHEKYRGPCFGDFDIYEQREGVTCSGNVYKLPEGMVKGSKEADEYLAGAKKFQVKEIEVFKVNK